MRGRIVPAVVAGAALVLAGCAARGTILDLNSHSTVARRMRLDRGRAMKIKDGGAIKLIPLRRLKSVMLDPMESRTFEQELYYEAKVELKDGTTFSSSGKTIDTESKTYVCVSDVLHARTQRGRVRIGLDRVSKIFFE